MDAGEPVVLLGDSGTGKSHLLIGLGLAACEQGRRVRYVTTAQLVNELVEAANERVLSRSSPATDAWTCSASTNSDTSNRPSRSRIALPDHHRTRRTGIGRDRHQPALQRMGHLFPDPRLVAAIVDRVTFNAHIIETGTKSYRLRTANHHPNQTRHLNQVGPKFMTMVGPNHLTKRSQRRSCAPSVRPARPRQEACSAGRRSPPARRAAP